MSLINWNEFSDLIVHYFAFLESEYGLKLIQNKEPRIIYESALSRVVIFYETHSRWDLDILIESTNNSQCGEFSFGISQFECLHRQDWGAIGPAYPPSNIDEFKTILQMGATRLKQHCSAVLKGDSVDVIRLQLLRNEFKKRLTIEYQKANRKKGFYNVTVELMNQILKEQNWTYL